MANKRKEIAEGLRDKSSDDRNLNKTYQQIWTYDDDDSDDAEQNTSKNTNESKSNDKNQETNKNVVQENQEEEIDITQLADSIVKNRPKQRKLKFEERHTKETFYVRNDILKAVNRLAGKQRGEKTRIINEALHDFIIKQSKEMEEDEQ